MLKQSTYCNVQRADDGVTRFKLSSEEDKKVDENSNNKRSAESRVPFTEPKFVNV
jgi:hypothetical protein